jgi:CheY-like chemotaxis protein
VNLFTNAAQSIGDLGTISCTLSKKVISQSETHSLGDLAQGIYAVFEIKDTGKGIETESIDRIFDPFFTTKQNAGGTGFGLSVVLGIVKSHQGAIRLLSDQSSGTTFHVYLPCIEDTTELPPIRPSLPKAGEGQRIMLIDDDKDVIDVTSKMIKRLGYSSENYLSSTSAVDAFQHATEPYALVITDFTMPIMRGDVVVERIREIDSVTPIILISGNLEGKNPDTLDPADRLHWLQKPFEYKELARAINKAIELGSEAKTPSIDT